MKSLHLTIMIFCQIILASFILYSQYTLASPVVEQPKPSHQQQQLQQISQPVEQSKHVDEISYRNQQQSPESLKPIELVVAKKNDVKPLEANLSPQVIEHVVPSQYVLKEVPAEQPKQQVQVVAASPVKLSDDSKVVPVVGSVSKVVDSSIVKSPPVVEEVRQMAQVKEDLANVKQQEPRVIPEAVGAAPVVPVLPVVSSMPASQAAPVVPVAPVVVPNEKPVKVLEAAPLMVPEPQRLVMKSAEHEMSEKKAVVPVHSVPTPAEKQPVVGAVEKPFVSAQPAAPLVEKKSVVQAVPRAPEVPSVVTKSNDVLPVKAEQPVEPIREVAVPQKSNAPVPVKGGLGPLHLLASSLCSYQPERLVADENLNLLYKERAAIRKSLFDFMSLKFTNLEKLSSRLNPGYASLEVVPPKKTVDQANAKEGVVPSHGWPVVGVCTAHDLKLMAEAAWCDSATPPQLTVHQFSEHSVDKQQQVVASNAPTQTRAQSNRSIKQQNEEQQQAASNDQHSAVISKMLQVNDVKDAPVIENSLAGLNLTQQQLVSIQAQATSTRECRRNALRLTKALFNHLAEDQKNESESWPKLYSHLADDECARKRMIDIVTALASFRGESTSIRRDNVEYAFAMDDLRAKVLESEVNVPLTFDKQFIEVEQFLQQSVKLMLANIDPGRARLTSMRYRSLMPGPVSADDQCIELHQRLLAKNYPTDCNPTQFGQLPDVLRMAASSLALWSIETELNKYSSRVVHEYPSSGSSVFSQSQVKQDVHECIANLVSA